MRQTVRQTLQILVLFCLVVATVSAVTHSCSCYSQCTTCPGPQHPVSCYAACYNGQYPYCVCGECEEYCSANACGAGDGFAYCDPSSSPAAQIEFRNDTNAALVGSRQIPIKVAYAKGLFATNVVLFATPRMEKGQLYPHLQFVNGGSKPISALHIDLYIADNQGVTRYSHSMEWWLNGRKPVAAGALSDVFNNGIEHPETVTSLQFVLDFIELDDGTRVGSETAVSYARRRLLTQNKGEGRASSLPKDYMKDARFEGLIKRADILAAQRQCPKVPRIAKR